MLFHQNLCQLSNAFLAYLRKKIHQGLSWTLPIRQFSSQDLVCKEQTPCIHELFHFVSISGIALIPFSYQCITLGSRSKPIGIDTVADAHRKTFYNTKQKLASCFLHSSFQYIYIYILNSQCSLRILLSFLCQYRMYNLILITFCFFAMFLLHVSGLLFFLHAMSRLEGRGGGAALLWGVNFGEVGILLLQSLGFSSFVGVMFFSFEVFQQVQLLLLR